MTKSLLILGAGGHGKVVKEIAEGLGYTKIGFLEHHIFRLKRKHSCILAEVFLEMCCKMLYYSQNLIIPVSLI